MCFNPCFRGTCSWWCFMGTGYWGASMFQSLFSWNLFLMTADKGRCRGGYEVSILVFVELVLDDPLSTRIHIDFPCFNPCFRGTCSWWLCRRFWMRDAQTGFNPCFRGTCSWWHLPLGWYTLGVMFQSLFSWNLFLMSQIDQVGRIRVWCFNPCFRGTCSWWLDHWGLPSSRQTFQSLFSWNLFLMRANARLFVALSLVSILVFVELVLDDAAGWRRKAGKSGFNPCFRGTCSWWRLWK